MGKYLEGMILANTQHVKDTYQMYLRNYLECFMEQHLTKVREYEDTEQKGLLQTTELLSSLLELQQIEKDLENARPRALYLVLPLMTLYQNCMSKLES